MAGGFPIIIDDIHIRTSEAIYQACRFPHSKEIQKMIIDQKSPMTAKMKSKPFRQQTRPDWENVKIDIMRWCLKIKLACNYNSFSKLLTETQNMPIVENAHSDNFWGAIEDKNGTLIGMNVLGRLLMELREIIYTSNETEIKLVCPLTINNFSLYNKKITTINYSDNQIISKLKNNLQPTRPKQLPLPFTT